MSFFLLIFNNIYLNFSINKNVTFITSILLLNNVKVNYLILLIIVFSLYFYLNIYGNYFLLYCMISYKSKKIFFILNFLNGLFKIHPILFYFIFILYWSLHCKNFIFNKFKILYIVYLVFFTFLLASLWSLYTLEWGKYWSSDSIEFVLLFFISFYLYQIHTLKHKSYLVLLNYMLLILFLILIRKNFIYSRHNFFNDTLSFIFFFKYLLIFWLVFYIQKTYTKLIVYINTNLFIYSIIITLIFISNNYLNNVSIKRNANIVFITFLFYKFFNIIWENMKLFITHICFFFLLILFILIKINYLTLYSLNNIINLLNKNLILNHKFIYIYNNNIYIKLNKKTIFHKNLNINHNLTINNYYLKKKLINFFF